MSLKASTQRPAAKAIALQILKRSHALAEWRGNRLIARAKQGAAERKCGAAWCAIAIRRCFGTPRRCNEQMSAWANTTLCKFACAHVRR